jgi:uncharacterized damage-inducible protein DinB
MDTMRYPIGEYEPQPFSERLWQDWIADIAFLPNAIEAAVQDLDEAQLDTPYREGGWTVKQLVHHVADSHINAYIRFKLALTEEVPTIKTYEEQLWAELSDTQQLPINISITLLYALHARWAVILRNMSRTDLGRQLFHPGQGRQVDLWFMLGMYAWHSRHHTAHITGLRERKGW